MSLIAVNFGCRGSGAHQLVPVEFLPLRDHPSVLLHVSVLRFEVLRHFPGWDVAAVLALWARRHAVSHSLA